MSPTDIDAMIFVQQSDDGETLQQMLTAEDLDYEIMRARTLATRRGATPAEIQRNLIRLGG